MKVVLISDTHLCHLRWPLEIPECDLLIHAGDALNGGSEAELVLFSGWFNSQKAKYKVFVPGNHDRIFEDDPERAVQLLPRDVLCLVGDGYDPGGIKIYGAPWQPEFCEWAFNLPRGAALAKKWAQIWPGMDILVTHGPPMGILDWSHFSSEHVGCADLRRALVRVKPKLHVFGHIHGSYGTVVHDGTLFVNAAICDEGYKPTHAPVVLEMEPGGTPRLLSSLPSRSAVPIRGASRSL